MAGERVLVTGAAGFVAMHVLQRLLADGYRVRGTLRDPGRGDAIRARLAVGAAGSGLEFAAADLTRDEGWAEAVAGCDYVLHVASPFPMRAPRRPADLIEPARDGTLRVLRAATDARVRRIVMTSSTVAVMAGLPTKPVYDAGDWSDVAAPIGTYAISKTLAERDARAFLAALPADLRPEFATINPGFILGPPLGREIGTSLDIVRKFLAGEMPGCPRFGFPIVDVRDIADAHVRAMTAPGVDGRRYICTAGSLWVREIGAILDRHVQARGRRIKLRDMPNWLVRVAALFEPSLRMIGPDLGHKREADSGPARRELGWSPRPLDTTIRDTADSLFTNGYV